MGEISNAENVLDHYRRILAAHDLIPPEQIDMNGKTDYGLALAWVRTAHRKGQEAMLVEICSGLCPTHATCLLDNDRVWAMCRAIMAGIPEEKVKASIRALPLRSPGEKK